VTEGVNGSVSGGVVLLRGLVVEGVADADLLAHVSLLVDAGLPLTVASDSAPLAARVADAFALASPVPGANESGLEILIDGEHHFEWLADPTGIGCMDPLAGSAPRSPRSSRLRVRGLLAELDPAVARTALRALSRGFPAIVEACEADLLTLFDHLRANPHRLPEDDLHRLGFVLCLDRARLTAAHLLHASGGGARRPPTLLAVWDAERSGWDDFAWAAVPAFAERCGFTQAEYAARHRDRLSILGAGELQ